MLSNGLRWAAAGLLAGACAASGAPSSTLEQKFTWYGYLAGADIRDACSADGPLRFRYVFNAIFTEEVRALDLEGREGEGAWLESRRYAGARVLDVTSAGLINRPDQAAVFLNAARLDGLLDAIVAGGFAGPAETGLILRSDDFYGVATGCRGGEFRIHGYRREALPGLGFVEALQAIDPLDSPWPAVYDTGKPTAAMSDTRGDTRDSIDPYFVIEIGHSGLRGVND